MSKYVTKYDLPQPSIMKKFKGMDDCIDKIAEIQTRHEHKDIDSEDAKIQFFACGLYMKAVYIREQIKVLKSRNTIQIEAPKL